MRKYIFRKFVVQCLYFYYVFTVREAVYAGSSGRQKNGDFRGVLTENSRPDHIKLEDRRGNDAAKRGAKLRRKLFDQPTSETKIRNQSKSANGSLERTGKRANNLPDTYVLVVVSQIFLFVPAF